MPKSKTTWSQDEIEDLVREYLWKSGLRPVEKTDEGNTDSKKRKPKTFQWGFKPRISLTTEVEPDPGFEEGEQIARCHNCGQTVRMHQHELPFNTCGVESGHLDANQSNESVAPREQDDEDDPEPVDIPLDPKLMPKGSAQALETAQKAQKEKEKKEQQEIARKRKKMRGESGKRPY